MSEQGRAYAGPGVMEPRTLSSGGYCRLIERPCRVRLLQVQPKLGTGCRQQKSDNYALVELHEREYLCSFP